MLALINLLRIEFYNVDEFHLPSLLPSCRPPVLYARVDQSQTCVFSWIHSWPVWDSMRRWDHHFKWIHCSARASLEEFGAFSIVACNPHTWRPRQSRVSDDQRYQELSDAPRHALHLHALDPLVLTTPAHSKHSTSHFTNAETRSNFQSTVRSSRTRGCGPFRSWRAHFVRIKSHSRGVQLSNRPTRKCERNDSALLVFHFHFSTVCSFALASHSLTELRIQIVNTCARGADWWLVWLASSWNPSRSGRQPPRPKYNWIARKELNAGAERAGSRRLALAWSSLPISISSPHAGTCWVRLLRK